MPSVVDLFAGAGGMRDEGAGMPGRINWKAVQWTIGTVIAAAAVIAALGGPEEAGLKFRSAMFGPPPPKIINVDFVPRGPKGSYIVTLRNPALEDVLITGYRAYAQNPAPCCDEPGWSNVSTAATANGAVTVMDAEESKPEACEGSRWVGLPRPLVIEARGARALQVRPWNEPCVFSIDVLSDHGESATFLGVSGYEE
jgi:hypothetical protein